jgi:hypothetical protein
MRFWYFKPISLAQQGQPRPSAAKSAGSEGCLVTNRCAMPRTFARTQFSTRPCAWFLTIGVVTKSFQFLGQAQHPRLFLSRLLLLLWFSRRVSGWGRRVSRRGFFGLRFGFSLSLRFCFLLWSGRFSGRSLISLSASV